LRLYELAAGLGNVAACFQVGEINVYLSRKAWFPAIKSQRLSQATRAYQVAATQDFIPVPPMLTSLCNQGKGASEDPQQEIAMLRRSVAQKKSDEEGGERAAKRPRLAAEEANGMVAEKFLTGLFKTEDANDIKEEKEQVAVVKKESGESPKPEMPSLSDSGIAQEKAPAAAVAPAESPGHVMLSKFFFQLGMRSASTASTLPVPSSPTSAASPLLTPTPPPSLLLESSLFAVKSVAQQPPVKKIGDIDTTADVGHNNNTSFARLLI
jgi:hypothetical protein